VSGAERRRISTYPKRSARRLVGARFVSTVAVLLLAEPSITAKVTCVHVVTSVNVQGPADARSSATYDPANFASYDPANGYVYLTSYTSTQGLVYEIKPSVDKLVGKVPAGEDPYAPS
jgi:hypothetical protein